ncbi:MAG: hypothetical protein U9Q77_11320 [Candidatus Marinimicrobia bacterium]|nr:hypothetical protein [Candidatus Neomarinimicrobiota bacterium]
MILNSSKQKKLETPYSFQDRFRKIQRIVIIYPESTKWLRIARYTLQRMYSLPEQFDFLLLLPTGSSRPTLDVQHEYADMLYNPSEDGRSNIQNRISAFDPDIILQLEPKPGKRLIKLIKSLNISLKIGFGSEESGLNVIYSQSESGFYEKNILNLIALIETK